MPLHAGHDDGRSLGVLVPEVLECVCAYLRPADLKSMRLVSRKMNDIALRFVLNILHLDLLPSSFDQLNEISTHGVLNRHVRTLLYFPIQFYSCESLDQFKKFVLDSLEDHGIPEILGVPSSKEFEISEDKWRKHYNEHEHQCHVQEDLLQGSYIESHMSKAFSSFPKLERIVIAPFCIAYPRILCSRPMRQTLREGTLLGPCQDPAGLPAHHPTSLLKAAAVAGVKLKYLSFALLAPSFFDNNNLCELRLTPTLAGLRFLRLNFSLQHEPNTSWTRGVTMFFKSCQNLENLEVIVQDAVPAQRPVTLSLSVLVDDLLWPNLRALMLHGIALQQDKLYNLVATRQPRLARIDLLHCPLVEGSWALLYEKLQGFFPYSKQGTDEGARFFGSYDHASIPSLQ